MVKADVYVRNISGSPQRLRHNNLAQLEVVPAAPGGWITVKNAWIMVAPGQIIRLPRSVWVYAPAACRLPWLREVTQSDFTDALGVETTASSTEATEVAFEGEVEEHVQEDLASAKVVPKKVFLCTQCGQQRTTRKALDKHMSKHLVESGRKKVN